MRVLTFVILSAALALGACKKAPEAAARKAAPAISAQELFGDGVWTENFAKARLYAAQENKPMLLFFTGSDWCGWCKKLDGEVFSDAAFQKALRARFVPVVLDFPSSNKPSQEVQDFRRKVLEAYGVKGYPTLVLTGPDGGAFACTGYRAGGPAKYLAHLDELLAQKAALDRSYAELKDGGEAEARKLYAILAEYAASHDSPCVKGWLKPRFNVCRAKCQDIEKRLGREERIEARLADLDARYSLAPGMNWGNFPKDQLEAATKELRDTIREFGLEGQEKQEVLFRVAMARNLVHGEDEEYWRISDEMYAAAPDTPLGKMYKEHRDARQAKAAEAPEK